MSKLVYLFEEGDRSMNDILGGNGANLAEMSNAGLLVPPGFTILFSTPSMPTRPFPPSTCPFCPRLTGLF